MNSNSTYLVKNRFGVYYFQKRLPLHALKKNPDLPKLVRVSLNTKSKKEALRLAMLVAVMWNLRSQQFFPDEEIYAKAMKLFGQFKKRWKMSFDNAQKDFLDSLDESDDYLLERATDYLESLALENGETKNLEEIREIKNYVNQNISINKNSSVNSIPIDEAFDDYINHCKTSWKKNSSIENSFRKSYYAILKAVTGEIHTGNITKQHISNFKK